MAWFCYTAVAIAGSCCTVTTGQMTVTTSCALDAVYSKSERLLLVSREETPELDKFIVQDTDCIWHPDHLVQPGGPGRSEMCSHWLVNGSLWSEAVGNPNKKKPVVSVVIWLSNSNHPGWTGSSVSGHICPVLQRMQSVLHDLRPAAKHMLFCCSAYSFSHSDVWL